jgi:site-specific DNA recombinase
VSARPFVLAPLDEETVDIYVRISYDPSGKEAGVERQEKECRDAILAMGKKVGEVFRDNDKSATSGIVRPEFERMLSLQRVRRRTIMAWHSDRIVRVMSDLQRLIELNVDILSVMAGRLDLSNATGRMTARLVTAVAQFEGEQKGDRQRASHKQRAAEGRHFWGMAPFGFTQTGEAVPHEADAVLRAYQDVLKGTAITSLANRFNREGFRGRSGKLWTPATMRTFLLSPRNAAIATYHGEEMGKATWDELVPEETYRAVVAVLTDPARVKVASWNKRGRKPSALLSSIARCGACNHTMRAARRDPAKLRTGEVPDIYVCRHTGCATAPIDQLDSMVLRELVDALGEEGVQRYWLADASDFDRGALNGQAAVLSARLSETASLYAAGVLTGAQLAQITGELRPQLEDIETQLAEHREPHRAAELLRDPELMWEKLEDMELPEARGLVEEVFTSIVVLPRGQKGVRFGAEGPIPFGRQHLVTEVRKAESPHAVVA